MPAVTKPLILSGSARGDGDLSAAIEALRSLLDGGSEHIALGEQDLRPFIYAGGSEDDAFLRIIADMSRRDRLILATPVYWYAMSATMKLFFDRLADLLLHPAKRPLGRALAGRKLWLLATGADPELPEGFEVPFRRTADYLKMEWQGSCYLHCDGDKRDFGGLAEFAAAIAQA